MAKDKARYFTFLLYPDSLPEDWEMKLESIGVPIAISPLHDKDLSDVKGQKYKSFLKRIQRTLGNISVAMVQIVVKSMENMYLYLTHESKDAIAKNKRVYDKKDIKLLNNFDIDRYITLDVEDKDDMLNDVCD